MSHREIMLVFSGLMASMLLPAMNTTVVATALPVIGADLGDLGQLPWIITTYLMAATISVPIAGKLGDIYGRRPLFALAISTFVIGSLLSGVALSMPQLLAARVVQGVGGGGIIALVFATIGEIVSPRQRGRYQGYTSAVFTFASIVGPLVGGFFADQLSWRWIFFINAPIGFTALLVTQRHLRLRQVRRRHDIDFAGAALLIMSVAALLLVTTWGGDAYAWTSPTIVGLLWLATAGLATLVAVEARATEPIVPLTMFRARVFTVSSVVGFVMQGSLFTVIVMVPLYLQTVTRVSATASGLLLVPLVSSMLVTNVTAGRLITRWGHYKVFPITGTALAAVGIGLLATMEPDTTRTQASLYMAVAGSGFGMINQVLVLAAQNAVSRSDLGAATSGVQFFRMLGGTIGLALYGAVLDSRLTRLSGGTPGLRSFDPDTLMGDPTEFLDLPPSMREALRGGLADALTTVFTLAAIAAVVAFAIAWFLENLHLEDQVTEHAPISEDLVPPADPT